MAIPQNPSPIEEAKEEEEPTVTVKNITLMNKMGFLQIKIDKNQEYSNILVVVEGQDISLYKN